MNSLYLLALVQIASNNVYSFKPNYAVQKESKSIFSDKKYTETIIPARYNAGNSIKYDNSATNNFIPEHYFPDVEYPINILEASKPFYVVMGENNELTPFTEDVLKSFNSARVPSATKKVSPKIVNETKPKTTLPKDLVPEKVDRAENITTINSDKENILNAPLRSAINDQPILFQVSSSTIEKHGAEADDMIEFETDSQEYYDYEDTYYDDFLNENNTVLDGEVEVFYSIEILNEGSLEKSILEDASALKVEVAVNNFNITQYNSTVRDRDVPENSTTTTTITLKPETRLSKICLLPVEKDNTKKNKSTVRKIPKRVGLAPVQNVKKRKFLQFMNTKPSRSRL